MINHEITENLKLYIAYRYGAAARVSICITSHKLVKYVKQTFQINIFGLYMLYFFVYSRIDPLSKMTALVPDFRQP